MLIGDNDSNEDKNCNNVDENDQKDADNNDYDNDTSV